MSVSQATHDQYGEPLPTDWVLAPTYELLCPDEIEIVFRARWYEADGWLIMSRAEIEALSEDLWSLEDEFNEEIMPDLFTINRVAEALKRGNNKDGFYHA